jgi:predicted permease
MSPRTISPIAAVASLVFGGLGLIAPQTLAASLGMALDPVGSVAARLACAAYVGYAVLAWMARDVTDGAAWRAIAAANAAGWGISGAALALSVASDGLDGRVWLMIATQVVFALAWASTYSRVARPGAASSPA